MSKKKIIYLNDKSDANQKRNILGGTEFFFPDFLEKYFFSDLDRRFMMISTLFLEKIVDLIITFDFNSIASKHNLKDIREEIKNFTSVHKLKKGKLRDGKRDYIVPNDLIDEWSTLVGAEDGVVNSNPINSEALYILLFSRFEANLEKLFDIFFNTIPDANTYEEKFTIKDLQEFSSIVEVGKYVHEKQIKKIMHESNKNKLAWMKKHVDFELSEEEQKIFDMFYALRNCIVHHDSYLTNDQANIAMDTLKDKPYFESGLTPGCSMIKYSNLL